MYHKPHLAAALIGFVSLGVTSGHASTVCKNPDALGPSKIFKVDREQYPRVGRIEKFPELPLDKGDIVLTFDDGPMPNTTPQVLAILASECVTATFFEVGVKARKWPEISRAVAAGGHTLGGHSLTHADLTIVPFDAAVAEIESGFEAVERAAYGMPGPAGTPRLLRFPNNAATPGLLDYAYSHGMVVVGVDMHIQDWVATPPTELLKRLDADLDKNDRGILLLHDSKPTTVEALPAILAELKRRHIRVVQLVP
jgi:peptidoglycan/xylan/chitin deacetylase (PgdA/CDA1 family)